MRFFSWFILAYLVLGVQSGLGSMARWGQAAPNLVLIAAVFIAINAPREAALLGCYGLGLMQDFLTQSPLGTYALGYGLVGMFVVSTQAVVYREHPLTHFSLVLAGGCICGMVLFAQGWLHPPRLPAKTLFITALYSAVLAPLLLGALQKMRRLFAFQSTRRYGSR